MKKITLQIQGMECPNCAMILEGIEDNLQGVIMAEASYHKTQMIVEYEEKIITEEQIKTEIQRLGYKVVEGK
ncbi:MAG: heavy-metal-associated domain-containing protein [Anaerolineaceae bacterium]